MKEQQIINAYEIAKERYAKLRYRYRCRNGNFTVCTYVYALLAGRRCDRIRITGFTDRRYSGLPGIIRERLVILRNYVQIS